jgi:hypothetical protein
MHKLTVIVLVLVSLDINFLAPKDPCLRFYYFGVANYSELSKKEVQPISYNRFIKKCFKMILFKSGVGHLHAIFVIQFGCFDLHLRMAMR